MHLFLHLCISYGSKREVGIVFREMLWKPQLTHAEGTQPCSALDNLRSGAEREQSRARRERSSSSIGQAPVTWEVSSLNSIFASLLFITGSGQTDHWQREWPRKRDTLECLECLFSSWGNPSFEGNLWRDQQIAQLWSVMELFFCLLIAQNGDGDSWWSAEDYSCQWSLGLQHEIPLTDRWHANIRQHQPSTSHLSFLQDCKRYFTRTWAIKLFKLEAWVVIGPVQLGAMLQTLMRIWLITWGVIEID